jgi:UDP-3-O-[3-hydroxymyristoyl] N-acetylglucosamine deacetylase / 3-hydroxyacyl-[acyl-carrier-protein] dehydratase
MWPPATLPPLMSVLAHRPPFLMVDTVLELRDGYVSSTRTFRATEPFFAGHFPGRPIVPGVFLL